MVLTGLGVTLLLAMPVLGPGLSRWGSSFLGADEVDGWGTQWFYWLIGRRILAGEPLAHTDLLFHPWGKDVYLHTGGNVLDAALALPFRYVLGPELGYNSFVLALLLTNGLCAALLARELRAPGWAAGLLGALVAFDPFVLNEIDGGRPTQALLAFLLLFWRDWLRLRRGPSWSVALRAALWMALTGLTYWFYAIFSGLAAVLAGLAMLPGSPSPRRSLGQMVVAGLLAAALALPLAWPMISALGTDAVPGVLDVASWTWTSWSPVTQEGWEVGMQVWDPLGATTGFALLREGEIVYVPGAMAMARTFGLVGLLGLLVHKGGARTAGVVLVVLGSVVAMGPAFGGDGPVDPAYLVLTELLPPMRRLWWPARCLAIVGVGTLVGAALFFARLRGRPRLAGAVGVLLLLGSYVELRNRGPLPLQLSDADVPEAYQCLASAEEGAIIELPMGGAPARLHYQAVHGKPLFGGMVEDNPIFTPREHTRFREQNLWIGELTRRAMGEPAGVRGTPSPGRLADAAAELEDKGFRYVVMDWEVLNETIEQSGDRLGVHRKTRHARVDLRELLGAPVWEDGSQSIYMPWGGELACAETLDQP